MIYHRRQGEIIRNGLNWNFVNRRTIGKEGWWVQFILRTPWFQTQFRYRSWLPGKHIREFSWLTPEDNRQYRKELQEWNALQARKA